MPRTTDARDNALDTAERLFRAQGYAATGLTQILEESGAPKGSFYHHFPGGKAQMAQEALERYAGKVEALIGHVGERTSGDCDAFVRTLCAIFAKEMQASQWSAGCMMQNFAAELTPADAVWTARLVDVEHRWAQALAKALRAGGCSRKSAGLIAGALLAGLTGARVLARVTQSAAPFDHIANTFAPLAQEAAARG